MRPPQWLIGSLATASLAAGLWYYQSHAPSPPRPAATLAAQPPPDEDDEPAAGLGVVVASALNVRPRAGTTEAPTSRLHCGDVVELHGREGDWYKVALPADHVGGYSHRAYIYQFAPGHGKMPLCNQAPRRDPGPLPAVARPVAPPANEPPDAGAPDAAPAPRPPPPPAPEGPPAFTAPQPPVPPKLITLNARSGKPGPAFPHTRHQASYRIPCVKCHHPVADGHRVDAAGLRENAIKDCHGCHNTRSKVSSKMVFHTTCQDCHRIKGAGPIGCPQCHKDEE